MNKKIRELGLAAIGAGVTLKEQAEKVKQKLVKKGAANKDKVLKSSKRKLAEGIETAGKEALVISKKSLQMLERELKKLEVEAKKAKKVANAIVNKRLAKKKPKKRR